ncbi:MAG TPA: tyrosine-type recombinase/integrase [Terriglobales bacterium]|nr:tyrosine-type recombinase/integrase [Terriglobales bacterium]
MNEATQTKRARGEGHLYLRGETWWMAYYDHGRSIRESTGFTREQERKAEKALRSRLGEVAAGIHRDTRHIKYEQLRDAFYQDYEINARKSLRRDGEGEPHLDKVARLDEFFSGWRVSEIDVDSIGRFIAQEQKRGLAGGTINRSVSALRRMFNLAKKQGKLREVPYFPMVKEAAPRQGFFEREQYDALFSALPDYLRLPLALGYFTGMREGEILGLRWNQVDFLSRIIRLQAGETKNGEGREIPIAPQLLELLRQQRARRHKECEYVCFRMGRDGRASQIQGFRKAWYAGCVKAGLGRMEPVLDATGEPVLANPRVDRKNPKAKPKMVYAGAIFHDLRRSGVRNLVRAGVPERVAMRISGHKTRSVFDRYNIVSQNDLTEAGRKLGMFHEQEVIHNSCTNESEQPSEVLQ